MDTQDIRTLKILEEIEKNYSQSQRDLSSKLNISLGLVNSFIKRLASKGYFKITTLPKNRVKYILTPKGALEKTRLTYQYLQYSFGFYRMTRMNLQKQFMRLVEQGVKRVVFYGVSDVAEIAYITLQETTIKMIAIVDEKKTGKIFLGNVVKSPDMLESLSFDRILITFMDKEAFALDELLKKGIARKDIIILVYARKGTTRMERLSKNLMNWPEITAFCLELRLSYLKSKESAVTDNDLIKKIFEEIVAMKEKKWDLKRHSPSS